MSKFLATIVAALALTVGLTGVAGATEYKQMYCQQAQAYCRFEKVVTFKTVVEYRCEREAFTKWVVEYDHCDRPYAVRKTYFREVQVPVQKQVAVVRWVKVCY